MDLPDGGRHRPLWKSRICRFRCYARSPPHSTTLRSGIKADLSYVSVQVSSQLAAQRADRRSSRRSRVLQHPEQGDGSRLLTQPPVPRASRSSRGSSGRRHRRDPAASAYHDRRGGQYADELGRGGHRFKQQPFKTAQSNFQSFTQDRPGGSSRWEQLHTLSLGAEKNFSSRSGFHSRRGGS